jgi:hypothetical protein
VALHDAELLELAQLSVRRVDLSASCTFERPDGKPVALQAQVINVGSNKLLDDGGWLPLAEPAADGDGVVVGGFLSLTS